ncbi:hypothetical protein [Acinetobacter sp. ASP199]|uniref:hypothetical protein n=1 Tax=unclassified Acinetobacter TaxID=196816 RepID=UPI001F60618C|nr:hypothetical protein [Acinetobacter sp. ASP199]UNT60315.1 hypothetical protein IHE35_05785 [Acinetobacter sp. ASP199]
MNFKKFLALKGGVVCLGLILLLGKYGYLNNYFDFMNDLSQVKPVTVTYHPESDEKYETESNESELPHEIKELESKTLSTSTINQKLYTETIAFSKTLPIQNEDKSTIIDAQVNDLTVVYTVVTPLNRWDIMNDSYINQMLKLNCNDRESIEYLEAGANFIYKFFGLDMKKMGEISINTDNCRNLEYL